MASILGVVFVALDELVHLGSEEGPEVDRVAKDDPEDRVPSVVRMVASMAEHPMQPVLTEGEKEFSRTFGARLAQLRKEQGLTQIQFAERPEITQQQLASCEVGRRRAPVSLLAPLADALAVSVEELLGAQPKARKCGPAPKLERHLERISQLPRARQRSVLQVLDSVSQQGAR